MAGLIEIADLSVIRPAWKRVFNTNDGFLWPFQEAFVVGRVFYPTDGYHLTREQYFAIVRAIRSIGEASFFLSVVESEELSFLDRDWGHWLCDLPSYEEYCELHLALENAFYSKNGCWGVLISHEMHALIGGNKAFLTALDEQYLEWASDLSMLRETWLDNANAAWLEPITSRVAQCPMPGI